MTNPVILGSVKKIGGELIEIELTESQKAASVVIHWPTQNTSISERRFPDLAATLTRLFANAATELARIKAGDRR